MKVKELMGKVMVALDEAGSFNLIGNLDDYKYKIYKVYKWMVCFELAHNAPPFKQKNCSNFYFQKLPQLSFPVNSHNSDENSKIKLPWFIYGTSI